MKDRYGRALSAGDVVLFAMASSGGIQFGRVSESQLLNNGMRPYGDSIKVVQLEHKALPRKWVARRLVVKVEESLLASARLMGVRPVFSDEAGK